ncbi:hypothetical protein F5B20DRAFT_447521 [Whalleya microplaca]|nr:hypothetical protein F5B20DRAFT_447521 [Whalleya microplaca]
MICDHTRVVVASSTCYSILSTLSLEVRFAIVQKKKATALTRPRASSMSASGTETTSLVPVAWKVTLLHLLSWAIYGINMSRALHDLYLEAIQSPALQVISDKSILGNPTTSVAEKIYQRAEPSREFADGDVNLQGRFVLLGFKDAPMHTLIH